MDVAFLQLLSVVVSSRHSRVETTEKEQLTHASKAFSFWHVGEQERTV